MSSFKYIVLSGVVIIGIVSIIAFCIGGLSQVSGIDQDKAEKEAKIFGTQLKLNVKGASCARIDSDNDGYVSCTLNVEENGKMRLEPIECAAMVTFNSGCRMQKVTGQLHQIR